MKKAVAQKRHGPECHGRARSAVEHEIAETKLRFLHILDHDAGGVVQDQHQIVAILLGVADDGIHLRAAEIIQMQAVGAVLEIKEVVSRMWWKLASSALRACNVCSGQAARSRDIGTRG